MRRKKPIAILSSIGFIGVIASLLISNNKNLFLLNGNAVVDTYGISFDSTKNKFFQGTGTTSQSGDAIIKTNLGNNIEFTYSNVAGGSSSTWHLLKPNGYFYNASPINGMTQISLTATADNKEFTIYWGDDLDYSLGSEVLVSSTSKMIFDFNDDYPSYFRIDNTSGSNLSFTNIDVDLTCINHRCELTLINNNSDLGTVSGSGVYRYSKNVTINAVPNDGNSFVGWYNTSDVLVSPLSTYTFEITSDTTLIAKFEITHYSLNVIVNDESLGSATGTGNYIFGQQVELVATPNEHCSFAGWYKNSILISNDATFTTTMPSNNCTIEARFVRNYYLNVYSDNESMGTVSAPLEFGAGLEVTVVAHPNGEYLLDYWANDTYDEVAYTESYTFIMPEHDVELIACFTTGYVLTLTSSNPLKGTVSGSGRYVAGRSVTAVLHYNSGTFEGWYDTDDNCVSTSRSYIFNMPSHDYSLEARFLNEDENDWSYKIKKFLSDEYDLEPYKVDKQGNVLSGDYDLDGVLSFYFFAQQAYGYTADPNYDFEINSSSGNKYAHLSYSANEETDEVDAAFFGYLGLADIPSYNEYYDEGNFYDIDWAEIHWDVEGIVNFQFDASMVLYSRPNDEGQYVCLEFYLDAYTSIDFDIYVSVCQAYSASQVNGLINSNLTKLGLTSHSLFKEGKSAADLSDWYYVKEYFDDEDNLTKFVIDVPVYSGYEANTGVLKNAFEEAIDDAWDVDNTVERYFGNFARSEAFEGKQVSINYQQYSDNYDASNSQWYKNSLATFMYNYYEFAFSAEPEVVTFNAFASEVNAILDTAGFETEIPNLGPSAHGQYQVADDYSSATFVALEPEAVETYQDCLIAALTPEEGQPAKWAISQDSATGVITATSIEIANKKTIELKFLSNKELHQFMFQVQFIDAPGEWDQTAVAALVNGFTTEVPYLPGEIWLSEVGAAYVSIYTNAEKAEGAEQTYLEQYAALFDALSEAWDVKKTLEAEELVSFVATSKEKTKVQDGFDTGYYICVKAYVDENGRFTADISLEVEHVLGINMMNELIASFGWPYFVPEEEGLEWYVLSDQGDASRYYFDIISEEVDWTTGYNAYLDLLQNNANSMIAQFGGFYRGSNANALMDYYVQGGMNQLKIEFVLCGEAYVSAQIRIYIQVEPAAVAFPVAFINGYLESFGYEQRIGEVDSEALFVGQSGWQQDADENYYYGITCMTQYEGDDELTALLNALDASFNVEGLTKDDSAIDSGTIVYASADESVSITIMFGEGELRVQVVMYDTEE